MSKSDPDAIYEDIKDANSLPTFDMDENKCYGSVSHKSESRKPSKNNFWKARKVTITCIAVGFSVVVIFGSLCGYAALSLEIVSMYESQQNISSTLYNSHSEWMQEIRNQILNLRDEFQNQTLSLRVEFQNQILNSREEFQNQILILREEFQNSTIIESSCSALPSYSPSGYYWIRTSHGSTAVRVYCDMTRSCGNITGGWMRVAELDMTNSSHQCPSGLREQVYNNTNIRTCVRDADPAGCSSVVFSFSNVPYSMICGRIQAYQYNSTNAFRGRFKNTSVTIDSPYVDGVSLTRGNPREHIWTFAAALDESGTSTSSTCSCNYTEPRSPEFVGTDYFCDTGTDYYDQSRGNQFYSHRPLWDGASCAHQCCSFNNPPWFFKQLQLSADDIEMRVCRDQEDEDVAIQMVEIYVQ